MELGEGDAVAARVLKGITHYFLAARPAYQLQALHHFRRLLVLDARSFRRGFLSVDVTGSLG